MKLLFVFYVTFLVWSSYLYGQSPIISTCGMEDAPAIASTPLTNIGGRYITSQGTIKAFILIARYSDDNSTTTSWSNVNSMPSWAQNLLNPTFSALGNYTSNSFSDYI